MTGDAAPCLGDLPPFLAEFSTTEGPKSMEDPATWEDEIEIKLINDSRKMRLVYYILGI